MWSDSDCDLVIIPDKEKGSGGGALESGRGMRSRKHAVSLNPIPKPLALMAVKAEDQIDGAH
jgi:hypothetical protein